MENIKKEENLRPAGIRSVLRVKHKEYLSPHYIRITLEGDEVPLFKDTVIGVNNKIFIPVKGEKEVHFDSPKSIRRTYTHRGIDVEKKEMIIDFVAHGEEGPASSWAINAQPGDPLGIAMKAKAAPLYPKAEWYLLVGDATAIPVLSSIMENLPPSAKGVAFIEVLNKEEQIAVHTHADIEINWIHNPLPGQISPLIEAVRSLSLPNPAEVNPFAYIAAEFSSVKDLRHYLRKEQNWDVKSVYAYSYWKYGQSEDGSVKERQEEKHSIA